MEPGVSQTHQYGSVTAGLPLKVQIVPGKPEGSHKGTGATLIPWNPLQVKQVVSLLEPSPGFLGSESITHPPFTFKVNTAEFCSVSF